MVKYKAGDVIMVSIPVVWSVKANEKGKLCDYCLAERTNLRRCAKCHEMYYCNRECQKADWKNFHRFKECNFLANPNSLECATLESDFLHLLIRFIHKTRFDSDCLEKEYPLYNGRVRKIEDIMDHIPYMEVNCQERLQALEMAADHLIEQGLEEDKPTIVRRAHQIFVNGYAIYNESVERKFLGKSYEIALGLFVEGSSLDHSCHPNASQVCENTRMEIRALRDIDTDKEEVFVSYVDLMKSRDERRKMLKWSYFFDCECEQCLQPNDDQFYKSFADLKEIYNECDKKDDYEGAFDSIQTMTGLVIKCLGPHSAWLTELLWLRVQFKLLHLSAQSQGYDIPEDLKEIWKEFKQQVVITHGANHSFYKSAMEKLKPLES